MPENEKRCSRCGELKPLTEFNRKDTKRLQGNCRARNAQYLKEHYRKNKAYHVAKARKNKRVAQQNGRAFIWRYLAGHPCVDCGETDPVVLQFDHVRDEKSCAVSSMLGPAFRGPDRGRDSEVRSTRIATLGGQRPSAVTTVTRPEPSGVVQLAGQQPLELLIEVRALAPEHARRAPVQ